MINLTVNGRAVSLDADPDMPLLWAVREELQLTGSKFGCGAAQCGACTMHVAGAPVRSCMTPISSVQGPVTTIEGIASDKIGQAVQAAWVAHDVAQCGYCQSGQVMSAVALLKTHKKPTDAQIDEAMAGNLCRCGTYTRIRAAIHAAAATLA
ncbi:(2Fe-2S)-binding protein [Roseateles puraquae]|jgi:isoquinoline 1-oxidoreductase alpha subunit|uniref:(2Fe-2S)-binding protein n=1 Tax=Roseateles puraquae TaxID=431059 RepID=A0A254NIJ6_9BURK|nr:(2Fe-2S)-binding protein [Roseateles puraquae]MDG0853891.1 (2Fe-2S)-binding protein [Roseateles puraquae]OWR04723.1 (2Fe-2S)-binding protein [Roseateles puraquae]